MENSVDKKYTPKEVRLDLNTSTGNLQKYCLHLEKNGYKFKRNEKNHREFGEYDLMALKHLQNLVDHQKMQVENAAMIVADRFGEVPPEEGIALVPIEERTEMQSGVHSKVISSNEEIMQGFLGYFKTLGEHLKTVGEINRELLNRLDRQENNNQELIREVKSLKKRFDGLERDRELMESLRDSQERKMQEVLIQIAAAKEEKKTGFLTSFKQLFVK
jgi:hypothetical protein